MRGYAGLTMVVIRSVVVSRDLSLRLMIPYKTPSLFPPSPTHTYTQLKLVSHCATLLEKRKLRAGEYLTDPHALRRHCENMLFLWYYECAHAYPGSQPHTFIFR